MSYGFHFPHCSACPSWGDLFCEEIEAQRDKLLAQTHTVNIWVEICIYHYLQWIDSQCSNFFFTVNNAILENIKNCRDAENARHSEIQISVFFQMKDIKKCLPFLPKGLNKFEENQYCFYFLVNGNDSFWKICFFP